MNLSQRLDAARRQRERGQAPPLRGSLRFQAEGQTYDGTDLRTGQRMTRERWQEVQAHKETHHLPSWTPPPSATDAEPGEQLVIDLTAPEPTIRPAGEAPEHLTATGPPERTGADA